MKLSNGYARWNHLERERQGTIGQTNSPYNEDDFLHSSELSAVDVAWKIETEYQVALFKVYLKLVHILLNTEESLLTYDFIPLIDVICAREQHAATNHFTHDAANWPNIHILFVTHAQNHFGGSIISRYYIWCHHEGCTSGSSQTKVEYFQRTIWFHYNIRRFQILKWNKRRLV